MNAFIKLIFQSLSILSLSLALHHVALADPPQGKGNGGAPGQAKKQKNQQYAGPKHADHERDSRDIADRRHDPDMHIDFHFSSNQRVVIHDYYQGQYHAGHCPPGLAKKNNGCLPPGQAKKWRKGYPLPRDVIYYDLPPIIIGRLDPPPQGYKYVRVAADILMIAIGTGMVIDAIEDLGQM